MKRGRKKEHKFIGLVESDEKMMREKWAENIGNDELMFGFQMGRYWNVNSKRKYEEKNYSDKL